MGDRIRKLAARGVEDSAHSTTGGLQIPSRLEYLELDEYPPSPYLSLPHTLHRLHLSNMCPLPLSISAHSLPPLLEDLRLVLAPFSADGKTSILPTPLDLSHLTQLTTLYLDGGEETSNLVSRRFFSTLKNATAISRVTLEYCVMEYVDFPDFIHWFFREKGDQVDYGKTGEYLDVCLFFGDWQEDEIEIARGTLEDCGQWPGIVREVGE
ncbi:hypothetical protein BT69DRAFT_1281464 [Atractiella rhizophila]|nr:hypothetical protein BT69DRAFT_1281464 [Atractiella rhizophila]